MAGSPGRPAPSILPAIKYNRARFDTENNVLFQVARRAPVNNCYYCHTSESDLGDARWHADSDVHIKAGLLCVDCHRNGLDHAIVRGYEGEAKDRLISDAAVIQRALLIRRDDAAISEDDARKLARQQLQSESGQIETLTCRGCHTAGRLGSPRLIHKGLPPIHLEKLACTACHSGPFPQADPQVVHTSLAHELGLPAPERGQNTAPVILEPVFLRGADGKIAPFKMVWPSYWARLSGTNLVPLLPNDAAKTLTLPQPSSDEAARDPYNTKPLTDGQIQKALESFPADPAKGEPVFIAAGKLYRLEKGVLQSSENPAAKPYAWPLAHDVRPAAQALGARGCADCHASDAPMYFATVAARGPVAPTNGVRKEMWDLRGDNKTVASFFAFTFHFRPLLKVIVFAAALLVLGVLVHYGLRGLGAMTAQGKDRAMSPILRKLSYVRAVRGWPCPGLYGHWHLRVRPPAHDSLGVDGPRRGRAALRPRLGCGGADVVRPVPRRRGFACEHSRPGPAVGGSTGRPRRHSFRRPAHDAAFWQPGQHLLYLTHRYSAIVLTAAVLLHLPLLALRRQRT